MRSEEALLSSLERIDGRGYKAYKDIQGDYDLGDCSLHIDHVQGDPFAAPSKLRLRVPMDVAGLPADLRSSRVRRLALADFLAREIRAAIRTKLGRRPPAHPPEGGPSDRPGGQRRGRGERSGSGKSGLIAIDAGAQEVIERTAVQIHDDWVEARLEVGLPASGRRVQGRQAIRLLIDDLPDVALAGMIWEDLPGARARAFVDCIENQEAARAQLDALGLVAFVGDGAVLPRESGASDRPLDAREAVPFSAPPSLAIQLEVPNAVVPPAGGEPTRMLAGMGVPKGVTLIVGGGYHGKSTLLRAIESAVHPHVPGDGREWVVAAPDLVKIRAEDGRRVEEVDIHPFIRELPGGRSTRRFCSDDASGSTSQAANIAEAIEAGSRGLLLDEDTSATNFMLRDARMQALVHREHEPITPLLDRVRELYERHGVSSIIVMGGSGDYFDVADHVVMMRDYQPEEVTEAARRIATEQPTGRASEATEPMDELAARIPLADSFDASRGRRDVKIDARGRDELVYGTTLIDLRAVSQLFDRSQTRAVGLAIHLATRKLMDGEAPLGRVLDGLESLLDEEGLEALSPFRRGDEHPGNLARPRRFEIAAALNRLRTLRIRQIGAP